MNFQGESRETKEIKRKKTRITIEKRWKVKESTKNAIKTREEIEKKRK